MLEKDFVEKFLKLNNVPSTASDDEIRAALFAAKWTEDEVRVALSLLRNQSLGTGVVAVSKGRSSIFRPDFDWSSEELSALLGVDVVVDPSAIRKDKEKVERRKRLASLFGTVLVVVLACVLALVLGAAVAYSIGAGPFHQSVAEPII